MLMPGSSMALEYTTQCRCHGENKNHKMKVRVKPFVD